MLDRHPFFRRLRNKRAAVLFALFSVAVAMVSWRLGFGRAPKVNGPLRHEVYVWQRAWTEPVRHAVEQHGPNFSALAVLKAEVAWKSGKPQVTRMAVDYATLAKTRRPVGIALRIGPYPGPFAAAPVSKAAGPTHPQDQAGAETAAPAPPGGTVAEILCDLAASLVAQARTNHVNLNELQIDFDCAESKLDGYRIWVEAIQHRVAPLPVTITALPSWLDSRAFPPLAAMATNYVLQVHSVARPKGATAPFTLCDPRAAKRAVERAGRIGIPFRVALPTYGYTFAFDTDGKFLGLSAEGPRPNWPANAQIREVASNPLELAGLVRDWTARRPAAMRGLIWYRLPTMVDNFNWRWPTLDAMLAARVPREASRVSARRVESGLVEISLVNEGELDISSRLAVEVRWQNARLVAGDALRDFELADTRVSAARFQTRSQPSRIRVGESLLLGWLRFDRDCEVQCELKKL